jgi:hypothetical protein
MSIDDILFTPLPGETSEAFSIRMDDTKRLFRNVFANQHGHKLINMLVHAINPTRPRFGIGVSPEMAAFRDGQCDVIFTLLTRGTNLGVTATKPEPTT